MSPKRCLAILLAAVLAAVSPGIPCYAALAKTVSASVPVGGPNAAAAVRLGGSISTLAPLSGLQGAGLTAPGLRSVPQAADGLLEAAQTSLLLSPAAAGALGPPAAPAAADQAPAAPVLAPQAGMPAAGTAARLNETLSRAGDKAALPESLDQLYDNGLRPGRAVAASVAAGYAALGLGDHPIRGRLSPASAAPAAGQTLDPAAAEVAAVQASGRKGRALISVLDGAVKLAASAGVGLVFSVVGLPFLAGLAAPAAAALGYRMLAPLRAKKDAAAMSILLKRTLKRGGMVLGEDQAPELVAEVAALARAAGIEPPTVLWVPDAVKEIENARTFGFAGRRDAYLFLKDSVLSSPDRRAILAHEVQHLADLRSSWGNFHAFAALALAPAAAVFIYQAWAVLLTALLPPLGILALWKVIEFLRELKADQGALALTGDADGLRYAMSLFSGSRAVRMRAAVRDFLARLFGAFRLGGSSASFADAAAPAAAAPVAPAEDAAPAYYEKVPDWAKALTESAADQFATPEEFAQYKEQLAQLGPLARWMVHFYMQLKEKELFMAPNLLTMQDIVNWGKWVRKFENKGSWTLRSAVERAAQIFAKRTLPPGTYEGRDMRGEFDELLKENLEILDKLSVPEHIPGRQAAQKPVRRQDQQAEAVEVKTEEYLDEEPELLSVEETDNPDERMDFILTPAVKERLDDLLTLYSLDHKEKFFPLLIGDTGEGKSTLVKYMFSEALRANPHLDGRTVPVISFPVKETTGGRELLGGNGPNGIELGALALAAKYGFVLVLEELNMANGEFLKALNTALQQITMLGYFDFEIGGQTVRIHAHPHFWVVGTENDTEGNYAFTRNEHSPDFVKRWVTARYGRIPPSEQATIMRGLAMRWAAKSLDLPKDLPAKEAVAAAQKYVDDHGLTQAFLEKLVVDFHEPVRKTAMAGNIGGDLQEPYEFNRRTLHRFLKRYLSDLRFYETTGRKIDDRTRRLLLARELMEAYGAEVREEADRKAIWDEMNTQFALSTKHKITREDIALKVRGLYQKDGKLFIDEQLVPVVLRVRGYEDRRMPGPEHRLTLTPTLAANLYRNARNRQFKQHQLFTGPTGTGKTRESFFMSHLLKEPLFSLSMHDQLPLSNLHGGYVKKRGQGLEKLPQHLMGDVLGTLRQALAGTLNMEETELVTAVLKKLFAGGEDKTEDFKFLAGILARAMLYDPLGLLKRGPDGKLNMTVEEIMNHPDIGAAIIFDEANASTIIESINPALDFGVLILSDGRRAAVAGGGFNATLAMNPVGEGYVGYPLSSALRSRTQIVHHGDDTGEEELAQLLLDQFTGVKRWKLLPGAGAAAP